MTEEEQQQIEALPEEVRIEDRPERDQQDDLIELEESGNDESPGDEEIEAVVIQPQVPDADESQGPPRGRPKGPAARRPRADWRGDEQPEDRTESDEQAETEIAGQAETEIELQQVEASDIDNSPGPKGPWRGDEQIEAEVVGPDPYFEATVESVIEAVLFASDESLTPARLAAIVETGVKQVREHIENLNRKYEAANNAFRIEQIAGGYQMLTLSQYNHWLKKLLRVRADGKLSPAALETLAIVAYKQPVMRADIEVIRGAATGEMLRGLMYKGLVKIVGRAEVLGRPMLYGTTKKFLEIFGLNSLKDLPKVEELKKPPA